MEKTTFLKSLLVAAALCVGASAWAETTVGATNYSTGYLGAKSEAYDLDNDGTWTFVFTNFNNVEAAGDWNADTNSSGTAAWNGFVLNGMNGTADVFNLRCDNWEVVSGSNTNCSDTWSDKGQSFAKDLNGASVNMTVTRNSGTISVNATITPTVAGHEFTKSFTYNIGTNPLTVYLSVDHSYLTISSANFVQSSIPTVNASIDFSNDIVDGSVAGEVNSMTIGATTNFSTEIAGDEGAKYLFLGDGINTVTIPSSQYAGTKDVVTIQFDMAIADGSDNHAAFYIQDADGANIGYMKCALWDAGSLNETNLGIAMNTTTFNKNGTSPKDALWNKRTSFTITLDYLNSTITTVSQIQGGKALDPITVAMTNKNPVAKFVVQAWPSNGAGGAGRRAKFGNLLIKTIEGDYSVATANYTVNWKVGDEIVKTDTRSGDVGSSITLMATDKETFFNAENTKKYSYVSDDSGEQTIASDGSTVVTVTFEEVGKYNYSVTTSAGSVIEEGTLYNDETKKITWSKYIEKDGTYYQATAPFQFTVTKDAASKEISVTESQVTQFVEATSSNWAGTGVENENLSGGIAYRGVTVNGTKTMLTVTETGIYSINYAVFSTNTGDGKQFDFSLYKNDATVDANLIETFSVNHSVNYVLTTGTKTIENVQLLAGDKIIAKAGNTSCALDYIALAKTGEAKLSATVTSAGWATLYTDNALDFSGVEGLEAYTATCSESTVTLKQVQNVPAGTGVVLKGAANTYNIPVIASSTTAKGDLLGSTTEATAFNAYPGYTLYMLNKVNGKAQFVPVTKGEIAAGKAFLKVSSTIGGARSLSVVFAEDATGINAVKGQQLTEGYYNLQGQRVSAPKSGLYIVNGKKTIIK